MIHTDHKLPIYWNKKVAMMDKEKFNAFSCKEIEVKDVRKMINLSFYENFYEISDRDKRKVVSTEEIDLDKGYEANVLLRKTQKLISGLK